MHKRLQDYRWFRETRAFYGFVGAFAVIAAAFIASSIVTSHSARSIDAATQDLLTNALPSVTELMQARTAQRRLDVDVDLLGKMRRTPAALVDELTGARVELRTAIDAAMETPDYPGERALYERDVIPRLARLDRAVEALQSAVAARGIHDDDMVAEVAAVSAAARELDGGLGALAELNHTHAYDAATRIAGTRTQTARLTVLLDIAASIVAILAAAIALRGGHRFALAARQRLDRETDRASELDLLAQRVAHDLMSPLATVALSLASLEPACADPSSKRVAQRARRALARSREIVDGIYQFADAGARPAPDAAAPLRATVLAAVDGQLGAEQNDPPTVDVQPFDDVPVAMDRALLGIVVTNLLTNAFKFTREAPIRRVTVRARTDERRVRVEIEDTGPGVPAALETAIFEPYRRAPGVTQPGLGLGLATVKRLVLAHAGRLGVQRAPSGGAIFWFEVPRATGVHAQAQAHPEPPQHAEAHPVH